MDLTTEKSPPNEIVKRSSAIDLIKILLITLVIVGHAGLPYFIGTGGFWYVYSSTSNFLFFSPWNFSFNAFIINTFFFIAGIFSFYSLKKYGNYDFVTKRTKRILLPLILGFLFILPPLSYYSYLTYRPGSHVPFLDYYFSYWFGLANKPADWTGYYPDMNLGHLWFLEHLFIYSMILVLLYQVFKRYNFQSKVNFRYFYLILLIFMTLGTYIMKTYHPATEMTAFLGFIQIDYTHVLENCLLFYGGVFFAKFDYKSSLSLRTKKGLFYIGLFLAILPFIIFYLFASISNIFNNLVFFAPWESLTAITFAIGIVVYLDVIIKTKSRIITILGEASYGIYVFHVIFVVFFQVIFENLINNVIIKFAVVASLSVVSSYAFYFVVQFLFTKVRTKGFSLVISD